MTSVRILRVGCVVVVGAVSAVPLPAQSLRAGAVGCKGETVSRIEVHARPPFEVSGGSLQQRIAELATDVHGTTNPKVIARFLELTPGEPCTELRRLESERILRAQPYLASASVQAFPDTSGMVAIVVETTDEVSLVLGGGGSGQAPFLRAIRIGEANLLGEALHVEGEWRYSRHFRDVYGARIIDYQLFGRPYHLSMEAARRDLGGEWTVEASHPFLTDLQRVSWRTTAGSRSSYRHFRRDMDGDIALPLQHGYADAGGVVRVGRPGRIALLGASVSYEHMVPEQAPVNIGPGWITPDTSSELLGRFPSQRSARLNALVGVRELSYVTVTGFESLDGAQDMARGVELAMLAGRGIKSIGSGERDTFVSAELYAGTGTPRVFAAVDIMGQGRLAEGSDEWDGILTSGRAASYLKAGTRHTVLASVEWSAGWRQRIPFQLSFNERTAGFLGYGRSRLGGGRRLITRLEDKIYIGRVKQFASVGVAPFVHAGRLWVGDAPFGVNSGTKLSAGVGLLVSVPPGSQRLWRLDVAFPINPEHGARWEVRGRLFNLTRKFWREPEDVARNRERAVPTNIFYWP